MVEKERDSTYTEDILRRGSQGSMECLLQDIQGRYSEEELNEILSGEGWMNVEGVAVTALAGVCRPLGVAGLLLIPILAEPIKGLLSLAFLLGYEKAKSEVLSESLGLEEK